MFKQYSSNELDARLRSLVTDKLVTDNIDVTETLNAGTIQAEYIDGSVIRTRDKNGQWQVVGSAGTIELPRNVEFSSAVFKDIDNNISNVCIDSNDVSVSDAMHTTTINAGSIVVDSQEITGEKIRAWDNASNKNIHDMDTFKLESKDKTVKFQMTGFDPGEKVIKMDSRASGYTLPKIVGTTLCIGDKCELRVSEEKTQVGQSEYFQSSGISIGNKNITLAGNRNIILGDGISTTNNKEMILGDPGIETTRIYGVNEYDPVVHTNPKTLAIDGSGELIRLEPKQDKTTFKLDEFVLESNDGSNQFKFEQHLEAIAAPNSTIRIGNSGVPIEYESLLQHTTDGTMRSHDGKLEIGVTKTSIGSVVEGTGVIVGSGNQSDIETSNIIIGNNKHTSLDRTIHIGGCASLNEDGTPNTNDKYDHGTYIEGINNNLVGLIPNLDFLAVGVDYKNKLGYWNPALLPALVGFGNQVWKAEDINKYRHNLHVENLTMEDHDPETLDALNNVAIGRNINLTGRRNHVEIGSGQTSCRVAGISNNLLGNEDDPLLNPVGIRSDGTMGIMTRVPVETTIINNITNKENLVFGGVVGFGGIFFGGGGSGGGTVVNQQTINNYNQTVNNVNNLEFGSDILNNDPLKKNIVLGSGHDMTTKFNSLVLGSVGTEKTYMHGISIANKSKTLGITSEGQVVQYDDIPEYDTDDFRLVTVDKKAQFVVNNDAIVTINGDSEIPTKTGAGYTLGNNKLESTGITLPTTGSIVIGDGVPTDGTMILGTETTTGVTIKGIPLDPNTNTSISYQPLLKTLHLKDGKVVSMESAPYMLTSNTLTFGTNRKLADIVSNAVVFGLNNTLGDNSVVLGNKNIPVNNSIIIGNGITNNMSNSIIIGKRDQTRILIPGLNTTTQSMDYCVCIEPNDGRLVREYKNFFKENIDIKGQIFNSDDIKRLKTYSYTNPEFGNPSNDKKLVFDTSFMSDGTSTMMFPYKGVTDRYEPVITNTDRINIGASGVGTRIGGISTFNLTDFSAVGITGDGQLGVHDRTKFPSSGVSLGSTTFSEEQLKKVVNSNSQDTQIIATNRFLYLPNLWDSTSESRRVLVPRGKIVIRNYVMNENLFLTNTGTKTLYFAIRFSDVTQGYTPLYTSKYENNDSSNIETRVIDTSQSGDYFKFAVKIYNRTGASAYLVKPIILDYFEVPSTPGSPVFINL